VQQPGGGAELGGPAHRKPDVVEDDVPVVPGTPLGERVIQTLLDASGSEETGGFL
jgi:hypothetical protein